MQPHGHIPQVRMGVLCLLTHGLYSAPQFVTANAHHCDSVVIAVYIDTSMESTPPESADLHL